MSVECTEDKVGFVFYGNTYPLRHGFDDAEIGGGYGDEDENGTREYLRVLPMTSVSDETLLPRVRKATAETLAKLIVVAPAPTNSPAAAFMQSLTDTS